MMVALCTLLCVCRTLYCAKGNYEFGITRIMKSLEPYSKKVPIHWCNGMTIIA